MFGLVKSCVVGVIAYGLFLAPSIGGRLELKSQCMNYEVPRYGPYRIHGKIPSGFEGFYEFELTPPSQNTRESVKADGKLAIAGALFVRPSEFGRGVRTESRGELNVDGAFSEFNVVRLGFKSATLIQQPASSTELEFETESIQEVRYVFKGILSTVFYCPVALI